MLLKKMSFLCIHTYIYIVYDCKLNVKKKTIKKEKRRDV